MVEYMQVEAQKYPHILVSAGLHGMPSYMIAPKLGPRYRHCISPCFGMMIKCIYFVSDPRVMYSEPAKWVAKLRDLKTDNNMLLFKCEFGAGHMSKSGR